MIVDIGLHVLIGLIGMFETGIYGSALAKKRRY